MMRDDMRNLEFGRHGKKRGEEDMKELTSEQGRFHQYLGQLE